MSVTVERLMVEVQADVRQALSKLDQVDRKAATSGGRMAKMSRQFGLAFGGAAVIGGLQKTIGLAADFDKTLRQVGVATDMPKSELESLRKTALKMGADTVFSAKDAGDAMLSLAKGGMSAADIQGGALEKTLTLAAAGGLDLASAADYMVQGLTTYGLKAKDAAQVSTALSGGANASTASVESLGQALSQVGPGAVNAGFSIQETVAALAAFDNAGIKGSDAGTSLKTMLASLVPATEKQAAAMKANNLEFVNADGSFKSLTQIAGQLQTNLGGLSDAQRSVALRTIFGSDATRAATALMREGEGGIRRYIQATNDRKKAQEMADSAMEGASGAWENLTGALETAGIQIGTKLLPGFTSAAEAGADFVNEAMTWGPAIEDSLGFTVDVVQNLGGPLRALFGVVKVGADAFNSLPGPVKEFAVAAGLAAVVAPKLSSAVSGMASSVSGRVGTATTSLKQFRAELSYSATRMQALGRAAGAASGMAGMGLMATTAGSSNKAISTLGQTAGGALLGFSLGGPWGAAIGAGAGALMGLASGADKSSEALNRGKGSASAYASTLDTLTGSATAATRAMVYQNLSESGALENLAQYGVSSRQAVDAAMGRVGASKAVQGALDEERASIGDLYAEQKRIQDLYVGSDNGPSGSNADKLDDLRAEIKTRESLLGAVENENKAVRGAVANKRAELAATEELTKGLKSLPKNVVTAIQSDGIPQTRADVVDLAARYTNLSRQDVKTLIREVGGKPTKAVVDSVIRSAKELNGQNPTPTLGARDNASGTIRSVSFALTGLNGKTATTYIDTIRREFRQAAGPVLKNFGFPGHADGGPTANVPENQVAGVVHGREFVMDAQTTRNARPLLEALHQSKGRMGGFRKGGATSGGRKPGTGYFEQAGDLAKELSKAVRDGMGDTRAYFRKLEGTIRRRLSGDRQKDAMKTAKAYEKRLQDQWVRINRVAANLERAKTTLEDRRSEKADFVGGTRDAISRQATVLNAGNSANAIQASLAEQERLTGEFGNALQALRDAGYSKDIVAQVAQEGLDGMDAAKALLTTTSTDQVAQINRSFGAIQANANATATSLGNQMYDAGIRAAQGVVDGLAQRERGLKDGLKRMASNAQDDVARSLGVNGRRAGGGGGQGQRDGAQAVTRGRGGLPALTPNKLGANRGKGGVSLSFVTHNPKAEPQSRTTNKALARVASLGLV